MSCKGQVCATPLTMHAPPTNSPDSGAGSRTSCVTSVQRTTVQEKNVMSFQFREAVLQADSEPEQYC